MVVKIYGFNVPVSITCKELGIPFEAIPVKMREGEHKSDHWISDMHPFGQIPVMVVSLTLFQVQSLSCAILNYSIRTGRRRLQAVRISCDRALPRAQVPTGECVCPKYRKPTEVCALRAGDVC